MAIRQYANAPATTLTASLSSVATSCTVASVAGLPISYPYTVIFDRGTATEEAADVTAAAGSVLTITRGVDGTTAFAHSNGGTVEHGITARDVKEPNAHINANSGVHGVTGSVVGTTDVQTLTNKSLTSPTLTGDPIAPTPSTSDNDTSVATTAFVKAALLAAHPVGTILMSAVNTNPSTYLGGTWVAWGSGRVPVGVDAGQTEFTPVEVTGGAKTHTLSSAEMPVHTHTQNAHNHTSPAHSHGGSTFGSVAAVQHGHNIAQSAGSGAFAAAGTEFGEGTNHSHLIPSEAITINNTTATNQNAGAGLAHNNLQPYITCYMFKRTA